jgi:hypothetical protein
MPAPPLRPSCDIVCFTILAHWSAHVALVRNVNDDPAEELPSEHRTAWQGPAAGRSRYIADVLETQGHAADCPPASTFRGAWPARLAYLDHLGSRRTSDRGGRPAATSYRLGPDGWDEPLSALILLETPPVLIRSRCSAKSRCAGGRGEPVLLHVRLPARPCFTWRPRGFPARGALSKGTDDEVAVIRPALVRRARTTWRTTLDLRLDGPAAARPPLGCVNHSVSSAMR